MKWRLGASHEVAHDIEWHAATQPFDGVGSGGNNVRSTAEVRSGAYRPDADGERDRYGVMLPGGSWGPRGGGGVQLGGREGPRASDRFINKE